ncbi:J domain-containing protein [Verrucomicrobium spinosum]|uniref:J domain-containing protein n=1 Tax=Verrucomicrobium spinosum TaxID=2736 RepID=UPI000946544C|nr:J domain-containing protein [Verrucomicrobium spinosum]
MTNAFDILALPARLSLDEGTLQQAYLSRSRLAHPDHGGSDREASEVNAAYEVLKAPDKRVKHLLEFAAPEAARSWRTVPLDERMMSCSPASARRWMSPPSSWSGRFAPRVRWPRRSWPTRRCNSASGLRNWASPSLPV